MIQQNSLTSFFVTSFGIRNGMQKMQHCILTNKGGLYRLSTRLASPSSPLSSVAKTGEESSNSILKNQLKYNASLPLDLHKPYYKLYYNDVYEVPLPPNHRFPMSKYRKVRERVQEKIQKYSSLQDRDVLCTFEISPLITKEDLITTHCHKYVDRYLTGDQTEKELRNVGFPWSPEGVNRSLSSTGGTTAAALSVCYARREQLRINQSGMTTIKFGPLFAAHIAGGTHHAFKDRGEGFSVFSDIAVAANVVLRDFPDVVSRILIIDLDVHQGNGNAVLFQQEDRVFTFSIHCQGNYFSTKEKSDLDIELPIGCKDETYLGTLNHWLKRIGAEAGKFDLIFYQAGVDIIENDRLGRMEISSKGLQKRNTMVYDFALKQGVPLVITMGGGYPKKDDWEPILSAHTDVYVGAYESIKSFAH